MPEVGLFEAKTHLSKLVEDIETGREKEIALTRRGKPVAKLTPFETSADPARLKNAFDLVADIRKRSRVPVATIKETIEEGRM